MFININRSSVFEGAVCLCQREYWENHRKVIKFTHSWNIKQKIIKGHRNRDIILGGRKKTTRWQRLKQSWVRCGGGFTGYSFAFKAAGLWRKTTMWSAVFRKIFWCGCQKSKTKQKKRNGMSNWCRLPSALFCMFSHRLVFLSHWDLIDCEHMDSYNTKRKECRVSAPRFGFMFGITRLLFTACSALA